MRYDPQTIRDSQRRATEVLATKYHQPMRMENGRAVAAGDPVLNKFYCPADQVTSPVTFVQEQVFTATKQIFEFDFSINGNQPSPLLNNNVIPKNNFAAVYGIQLLIGNGEFANNRTYQSSGFSPSDNSIYNSIFQMKIESGTVIDILEGQNFLDTYQTPGMVDATSGLVLINPIRVLSGEYGIFKMFINLKNSISALVLTPNLVLSMRLHAVMGQASGK